MDLAWEWPYFLALASLPCREEKRGLYYIKVCQYVWVIEWPFEGWLCIILLKFLFPSSLIQKKREESAIHEHRGSMSYEAYSNRPPTGRAALFNINRSIILLKVRVYCILWLVCGTSMVFGAGWCLRAKGARGQPMYSLRKHPTVPVQVVHTW